MTKQKHRKSAAWTIVSEDGELVAYVQATKGQTFYLDLTDWERVRIRYGEVWWCCSNGQGREYIATDRPEAEGKSRGDRHVITLGRAVLGALPGQRVRYWNGNPFDCRRRNLYFG